MGKNDLAESIMIITPSELAATRVEVVDGVDVGMGDAIIYE